MERYVIYIIWRVMNKMQNTLWCNPLYDQHFIGKKTEMRGYTEKVVHVRTKIRTQAV